MKKLVKVFAWVLLVSMLSFVAYGVVHSQPSEKPKVQDTSKSKSISLGTVIGVVAAYIVFIGVSNPFAKRL